MTIREKYRRAGDRLAYMVGRAPNFPPSRSDTFSEAFAELLAWLDDIFDSEKREVALAGLSKCKETAMQAKKLFDQGDERRGSFSMQCALQHLEFAAKGKPAPEQLFRQDL